MIHVVYFEKHAFQHLLSLEINLAINHLILFIKEICATGSVGFVLTIIKHHLIFTLALRPVHASSYGLWGFLDHNNEQQTLTTVTLLV